LVRLADERSFVARDLDATTSNHHEEHHPVTEHPAWFCNERAVPRVATFNDRERGVTLGQTRPLGSRKWFYLTSMAMEASELSPRASVQRTSKTWTPDARAKAASENEIDWYSDPTEATWRPSSRRL
jgi:hypothetical protein